eukprot:scaffold40127_cov18-Tisochrysis_lutea.AAC.1
MPGAINTDLMMWATMMGAQEEPSGSSPHLFSSFHKDCFAYVRAHLDKNWQRLGGWQTTGHYTGIGISDPEPLE